ncbi:MAG: clostripain-related cysteine peptidase [Candidatus Helarchaeota archaeon]
MNKRNLFLSILIVNVLFLQLVAPSLMNLIQYNSSIQHSNSGETLHKSDTKYKWTYIGYFCADNNLDEYGVDDINEIETGMDNLANISIITIIDRYHSGATTYRIQHDTSSAITSPIVHPTGIPSEPNMGDGTTLRTFLKWVFQNYPAEKYVLDLWDHGGGWFGISFDDHSGQDGLSLAEVRDAISGALADAGEDKIDIISMDACLMGMLEVMYYLQGLCDVLVSSEETIYAPGYPYKTIIGDLCLYGDTHTTYQISSMMVDNYETYYSSYSGCTLSAVNLSSTSYNDLTTTFSHFADSLYNNLLGQSSQVQSAREQTQEFYYPSFIDLYDFCDFLTPMGLSYISSNASALKTVINKVVINYAATGTSRAKGISIYFPKTSSDYRSSYGSQLISTSTNWDNFLNYYYTVPKVSVDISNYYTNETIKQGKTLKLSVTLKNTGEVLASCVNGSLQSNNPNITVNPANNFCNYGSISINSYKTGTFIFNVSPTIINRSMFILYFIMNTKFSGITRIIHRNISLYFIVGVDTVMGGDSFNSAVSISWGESIGILPGPANDRSSWYKINISKSVSTILFNLTSPVPAADFDLYIYSPSGILITAAVSSSFPDLTSVTTTETGEYRIKVHPYTGEGLFILNLVKNQTCEDGNSIGTSFEINLPTDAVVYGSLPNSGNSNGYLIFRIVLLAGQVLILSLTGDAGTDFDIYILDSSFTSVDSSTSSYYPERTAYRAETSGVHYIILSAYSGSGSFSMEVSVSAGYFFDWTTIILIIVIVIIVIAGIYIYWRYFT